MKALIVTYDKYPDGDAGAVRIHYFAQMLKMLDYDVFVVGMGPNTGYKKNNYDGISYVSMRSKKNNIFYKCANYLKFNNYVINLLRKDDFEICLHTQLRRRLFLKIKHIQSSKQKQIIFDAVEWFSPSQFELGKKDRRYKINDDYHRNLIDSKCKVISISNYLYEHYKNSGIRTVNIPVVMDVNRIPHQKQLNDNYITLMYAGTPGKKDYLGLVFESIFHMKESNRNKLRVRIFGITRDQWLQQNTYDKNQLTILDAIVSFYGRIDRKKILQQYEEVDFSILIRSEEQRYAKAGFPTKFVESMATGTPIMCNLTSDLGLYVEDGVNSMIIKDTEVRSIEKKMEEITNLSKEKRLDMSYLARETAIKYFDYSLYIEKFNEFIEV